MRWRDGTKTSVASNGRAQGCRLVTSDQRGFIQGKNRLIRNEGMFVGNFHQTSLEGSQGDAAR